jgi:SAM-dependent methyltransferase
VKRHKASPQPDPDNPFESGQKKMTDASILGGEPTGLENSDNFPGWGRASAYLQKIILDRQITKIADLGGGANPLLDDEFIRRNGIDYYLIDISKDELEKANPSYRKIQLDITSRDEILEVQLCGRFELVFSHMFLEHIADPQRAHSNIHKMLASGGLSIHFYPSPNNLPLLMNRLMPERLSGFLLKLAQPWRHLHTTEQKFKAYYRRCGAPSMKLRRFYDGIGFKVLRHTGYVGHEYYDQLAVVARGERALRKAILRFGLPLTAKNLLVLQKI